MTCRISFSHAFQPIVDIDAHTVISYEVLLRGKNNESAREVLGQVLDEELLAFDQAGRERAMALAARLGLDRQLNLNFTPGSLLFEDGKYINDTIQAAKKISIEPGALVFEIMESEAVSNSGALKDVLNTARRSGVTIAIDDFGAGYAGLNLLADIQPDWIKLDMYLLRSIEQDGARQAIVRAICGVCLDLGIEVLAEGVETQEEFRFLRTLGISLYQGYLFAKPGFESLDLDRTLSRLSKHFPML